MWMTTYGSRTDIAYVLNPPQHRQEIKKATPVLSGIARVRQSSKIDVVQALRSLDSLADVGFKNAEGLFVSLQCH